MLQLPSLTCTGTKKPSANPIAILAPISSSLHDSPRFTPPCVFDELEGLAFAGFDDRIRQQGDGGIKSIESSDVRTRGANSNPRVSDYNSIELIRGRNRCTASHTPENVAGLCTINQQHLGAHTCAQGRPNLEDELYFRVSSRVESDIAGQSSSCREFVYARAECEATERNAGEIRGEC